MSQGLNWRTSMCKSLGLVAVGFVASVASAFFYLALAVALKRLGVPPASWFGSDYIDPRCSAVAGGSALFSLAVFSFGAGAFANKHLGPVGPAGAFWLCYGYPVSFAFTFKTSTFKGIGRRDLSPHLQCVLSFEIAMVRKRVLDVGGHTVHES